MTARRSGYTLMELLAVIAILAALGGALIPTLSALSGDSRVKAGADTVRSFLAQARAAAIEHGQSYRVAVTEDGTRVRVAYDGRVDGCDKAGEITVSVKDRVGFYDRNDLKVKDELESLARNQAVSLPADTVVARGEPRNGEQSFDAYRCGTARRTATTREYAPARDKEQPEAQTFPVR